MIDPEPDRRALLGGGRHFRRQFEAQEVHGGRLDFGFALQVLVGDGLDTPKSPTLQPTPPSRTRSSSASCRLRSSASGNSSISVAFQLEPRGSADYRRRAPPGSAQLVHALEPDHLLHLIKHRQLVLEMQRGVGAERDSAQPLVRNDLERGIRGAADDMLEAVEVYRESASSNSVGLA